MSNLAKIFAHCSSGQNNENCENCLDLNLGKHLDSLDYQDPQNALRNLWTSTVYTYSGLLCIAPLIQPLQEVSNLHPPHHGTVQWE